MFVLVTGGSASGKSEYAENRLMELREEETESIYIATMQPFGKEAEQRIEKHRRQRALKHFNTVECYRNLELLELPKASTVLLECMSNLTANEMFAEENTGVKSVELIADKIVNGVKKLILCTEQLVIVTNEVFSDTLDYDKETLEYIRLLGIVNQRLARMADEVVEVVYGIPLIHK